jgi:hypothetical protein
MLADTGRSTGLLIRQPDGFDAGDMMRRRIAEQ